MLAALPLLIATGCGDRAIDPDAPASHFFSDPKVAALAAAAAAGDVAKIDALVARGVDVNATGRGNITPLFRALVAENKAGYEALLRHGANPNILARVLAIRCAVMHMAANKKDPFWLKLALEHGGDPNLRDGSGPKGQTPIFYAISMSFNASIDPPYAGNVKILIDAGADVNATRGPNHLPPLLDALKNNHYETVYYLIAAGADTSVSYVEGWSLPMFLDHLKTDLSVLASDQIEWFWKVVDLLNERGVGVEGAPASPLS